MEERVYSKQEVIEETIKILGSIQLPMAMVNTISAIHGSIRNLKIVVEMLKTEDEIEKNKDSEDPKPIDEKVQDVV